jgi:hypothetical protein
MLGVVLGLVGCAAPQYIPLTQDNAAKIRKVDVRSVVVQDEVIAKADPSMVSAAMGGGLIPALVDASITRARQERLQTAMEAFYAAVEDYDFRADYWPQLTRLLQEGYPLKVVKITTTPRTLSSKERQQIVPNLQPEEAYLLLLTDYYLSTDLRSLNVSTVANLWVKGQDSPVYKNRMTYQSKALPVDGEQAAKAWATDNGKPFYDKLKEGIRETLAMLSLDAKPSMPVQTKPEQVKVEYNFGQGAPASRHSMQGTLVEKRGDRYVIRDAAGQLYSLLP